MSLGQYFMDSNGNFQGVRCKGIVRRVNEDPVDNAVLDAEIATMMDVPVGEVERLLNAVQCESEVKYLMAPKQYPNF